MKLKNKWTIFGNKQDKQLPFNKHINHHSNNHIQLTIMNSISQPTKLVHIHSIQEYTNEYNTQQYDTMSPTHYGSQANNFEED